MRTGDLVRLVGLAAIWGASFIFIRVSAPALGPAWITEGRLLIGGGLLLAWFRFTRFEIQWRRYWRFYAITGILGTAIPFLLYGYAGMHIPGAMMAIINTTAPMFALIVGAAAGMERISVSNTAGLILGAAGVALVTRSLGVDLGSGAGANSSWAIASCLGAALAYGLTSLLVKRWGAGVPSRGIAVGAQVFAALVLVPLLPMMPPPSAPSALVIANLLALGIAGSAFAYLLFFRLIADIGAVRAQSVSLLIPAFSMLWGAIFLGETMGWSELAGAALILMGTLLVTWRSK